MPSNSVAAGRCLHLNPVNPKPAAHETHHVHSVEPKLLLPPFTCEVQVLWLVCACIDDCQAALLGQSDVGQLHVKGGLGTKVGEVQHLKGGVAGKEKTAGGASNGASSLVSCAR